MATVANLVIGFTAEGVAKVESGLKRLNAQTDKFAKSAAGGALAATAVFDAAGRATLAVSSAFREASANGDDLAETLKGVGRGLLESTYTIPVVGKLIQGLSELTQLFTGRTQEAAAAEAERNAVLAEAEQRLRSMEAATKAVAAIEVREVAAAWELYVAQGIGTAEEETRKLEAQLASIANGALDFRRKLFESLPVDQAERLAARLDETVRIQQEAARLEFDRRREAEAIAAAAEAEAQAKAAAVAEAERLAAAEQRRAEQLEGMAARFREELAGAGGEFARLEAQLEELVREGLLQAEEAAELIRRRFAEGMVGGEVEAAPIEQAARTVASEFRQATRLTLGAGADPKLPQLETSNRLLETIARNTEAAGRAV